VLRGSEAFELVRGTRSLSAGCDRRVVDQRLQRARTTHTWGSLEAAEHPVGGFWLDLVGTDLTHGSKLIVENQIGDSDHRHLGQLLTYAGTDAGTIVWVAKTSGGTSRRPHWLNAYTDEGTRFFGVVVRALQVGDSKPAPFLEVVAKPNDWQKTMRRATTGGESSEHAAYRALWAPFESTPHGGDSRALQGAR
jgi:hypothetical protein